eukprot:2380522-Rhodomonas_salina.2
MSGTDVALAVVPGEQSWRVHFAGSLTRNSDTARTGLSSAAPVLLTTAHPQPSCTGALTLRATRCPILRQGVRWGE